MTNSQLMAKLEAVSKEFGEGPKATTALREANLEIREAEMIALMGPSGCGKSTLLRIISLLAFPTSGSVMFAGQPAPTKASARAHLRNELIGFLHQEYAIIDDLTVEHNVSIPLDYGKRRIGRRARRTRVTEMLALVDLEWALTKKAKDLSGGEKQRTALARSLINNPRLIVADEPTAALDPASADSVLSLLAQAKAAGSAILLATHDPRVAERCDRVVRILDGVVLDPDR